MKLNRELVFLAVVGSLMLSLSSGCKKRSDAEQEANAVSSRQKAYPFVLPNDQLRVLAENAARVSLGATREEVKAILGQPWEDMPYGPKERNETTGHFVKYYARKTNDGANNNDQVLTFYFDANDHLLRVNSNIPGIPSRP